jgi:hypothetical protein
MSVELHVIFNDSLMPDVQQWQGAITSLGFDVQLDAIEDLRHHSGFLPATIRGQQSGFEFDVSPATEIIAAYRQLASRVAGRDSSANFRFGGDLSEMACAMAASAAFAKLTDGVWFDPQDAETQYSIEAAIAQARSSFDEPTQAARPLDNKTLQRTGAAGKRSWFQKLFSRGPGR